MGTKKRATVAVLLTSQCRQLSHGNVDPCALLSVLAAQVGELLNRHRESQHANCFREEVHLRAL